MYWREHNAVREPIANHRSAYQCYWSAPSFLGAIRPELKDIFATQDEITIALCGP